jgi:hypothetical protein
VGVQRRELASFARVAADFQNERAFAWLLGQANADQRDEIAALGVAKGMIGPLLDAGFELALSGPETAMSLGNLDGVDLLRFIPLVHAGAWAASLMTGGVDKLLATAPPVPAW